MKNKKIIIGLIIGLILITGITSYAAYQYQANNVSYKKINGTEVTVAQALNELYANKKSNISNSTADNYSTEEQVVGTWINGETIYQKTIDFGSLPNGTTKQVEHNIDNLSMIVNMYCIRYSSNNSEFSVVPSAEPNGNSWASNLSADSTYVKIKTAEDYSFQKAYITIKYTKTTD